jgi:hypothetical protein
MVMIHPRHVEGGVDASPGIGYPTVMKTDAIKTIPVCMTKRFADADIGELVRLPEGFIGLTGLVAFGTDQRKMLACLTGTGKDTRTPWLHTPPDDDALVCLPGVGPKTASWVVRNWRRSDKVAILDVHIARAGRIAGFRPADWDPARHYPAMESAFLRFSEAIGVRPSVLDGIMWDYMRCIGPLARAAQPLSKRYGAEPMLEGTPTAAVPHATTRSKSGKIAALNPFPRTPSGQKPRPKLAAHKCSVASSAPASRQSRLPGFA